MKQQNGFTLIELIMVIVILGILAATAIPKFIDLSADANKAAAAAIGGALSSGGIINRGACEVGNAGCVALTVTAVAKCSGMKVLMNPAVTITVGAIPATTVKGTLYMTTDPALTTIGVACPFTYGDGGAGVAVDPSGAALQFIGLASGT